jgi:hypothetical protein
METNQPPPLGESRKEVFARTTATTLKAAANAIPIAGLLLGPAVEIALNEIIPGYRLDRIEDFLRYLDRKANHQKFEEWVKTEDGAEHFEEAIRQAAKSRGERRREYLANLVVEGMSDNQAHVRRARQMLRLIEMIDDDQVIILTSKLLRHQLMGHSVSVAFWKKHRDAVGPFSRELSDNNPDGDKAFHKDALEDHLVSLGLLTIEQHDLGWVSGGGGSRKLALSPTGKALLEFIGIDTSMPKDL